MTDTPHAAAPVPPGPDADFGLARLTEPLYGWHQDFWCERYAQATFCAQQDITGCQLEVWLEKSDRTETSRLALFVDDEYVAEFAVLHDHKIILQFGMSVPVGRTFTLSLRCDYAAHVPPPDVRDLSYCLVSAVFY